MQARKKPHRTVTESGVLVPDAMTTSEDACSGFHSQQDSSPSPAWQMLCQPHQKGAGNPGTGTPQLFATAPDSTMRPGKGGGSLGSEPPWAVPCPCLVCGEKALWRTQGSLSPSWQSWIV